MKDDHHFPVGDYFAHDESAGCPCHPSYATVCVLNRGYVMRWEHKLVQMHPMPDRLTVGDILRG